MTTTTTDAQLVADHLAGDRAAFAAMYDRYGDTLYDTAVAMTHHREDAADITQDVFVVAAERMSQLRDPSRLKPWLFAILRNEVYRRSGNRKRVVLTDFTEPVAEMALPPTSAEETADLEYQELAELVRGAAFGLDERDQLVLEYSVRQGLQGDDLADALGVSAQQSYGLVHRMRERTERSLGAYCVARRGRKDCDELAKILQGWDGEFTVLIRKRVARHIDACDTCERSRGKLAPLALFGAAPAFAAPAGLRDRVLAAAGNGAGADPTYGFGAPGGFPAAVKHARRLGLWIALSTLALLFVGGATVWVLASGDNELAIVDGTTTTTAVAPAPAGAEPTAPEEEESAAASPVTAADSTTTTGTAGDTTTTVAAASAGTATSSTVVSTTTTTTAAPIVVTLPSTTTTTTIAAASPPVTTTTTPAAAPPPPTTTTTPATTTPPGALTLSAGSVDFGTTTNESTVTLTNTGGQAVNWNSSIGPAAFKKAASPFSAAPSSGSLAPGASVVVTLTIDRTWPIEGPLATDRLTFAASGTNASIDLDGTIARDPIVNVLRPGTTHCPIVPGAGLNPLVAAATVSDESTPLTVVWRITGPGGNGSTMMTMRGAEWWGSVVLDFDGDNAPNVGLFTWSIVASDAFGNSTTETGETDVQTWYCT